MPFRSDCLALICFPHRISARDTNEPNSCPPTILEALPTTTIPRQQRVSWKRKKENAPWGSKCNICRVYRLSRGFHKSETRETSVRDWQASPNFKSSLKKHSPILELTMANQQPLLISADDCIKRRSAESMFTLLHPVRVTRYSAIFPTRRAHMPQIFHAPRRS